MKIDKMVLDLDFNTLQKIINLDQRRIDSFHPFCHGTCCDYVDSICFDGKQWRVIMFVEPCGNIEKRGEHLNSVLDWWIEVFKTQPKTWDYIKAGWHLWGMRENLPDNVSDVWRVEFEAIE